MSFPARCFHIAYQTPYQVEALLQFLDARAITDIEHIDQSRM